MIEINLAITGQEMVLHVQHCSKCKRTHTRRHQRYCHACHAAANRRHRARAAAVVDELVRVTGGKASGAPRTRRVAERVRKLDALAAAASGIARSSAHRARQATSLVVGVAVALGAEREAVP